MTEPLVSGEVVYNPRDFRAFARRVDFERYHYFRLGAAVIAGLMALTIVLYWALRQPLPIWQVELGLVAAAALWLLSTGRLQARIIARNARQAGLGPQTYVVSEEGFEVRAATGDSHTKWSEIPELDIEEGRLFVFLTDRKAFIVPSRAFASEAEFDAFAAAAKAHWKVHHRL
jgi:hypothetical protein